MNADGAAGATRGSGFAARASKGAGLSFGERSGYGEREFEASSRDGKIGGARASSLTSDWSTADQSSNGRRDPRRVKRLAAVAAASVAVAFASVAYGLWAQATASAAVEAATSGARPTLVATADIQAGDLLTGASLEAWDVPAAFRASTALGAEGLEDGAVEGRRALVDIPAGAQITASVVTGSGGDGRLAADLRAGMEAVTVGVDTETGLAGRIRVYDTVRVVSAEGASSGTSLLTTLCERARGVAVGEGAGGEGPYASVTVEVEPSQADAVREAQFAGRVSLILVASEDALEGGEDHG